MPDIVLIILFGVLLLMLFASYVIASFGLTFLAGAPFVGTPKAVAREMLALAELKPGEVFTDIGSGNGTLLITAVKEFGAKRAVGYEINPVLVFWTKIRAALHGVSGEVEVRRANFFKTAIEPADVVGLFLLDKTMDRLFEDLRQRMSPGTRVVSRGFQFQGVPFSKRREGKKSTLYLYLLGERV